MISIVVAADGNAVTELGEAGSEEDEEEVDAGTIPRVGGKFDASFDTTKDALGRSRIEILGNTFKNHLSMLGDAKSIIHSHYNGSWQGWSEIPETTRAEWFAEFQTRYYWNVDDSAQVLRIWRKKCSEHIQQSFADANIYN